MEGFEVKEIFPDRDLVAVDEFCGAVPESSLEDIAGFEDIKAIDDKIGRGASLDFCSNDDFKGPKTEGNEDLKDDVEVNREGSADRDEGCADFNVLLAGDCFVTELCFNEDELFGADNGIGLESSGIPLPIDFAGGMGLEDNNGKAVVLFGLSDAFKVGLLTLALRDETPFLGDDNGIFRSTGREASSIALGGPVFFRGTGGSNKLGSGGF